MEKFSKDEVILANGFLVLSNDKMSADVIKFDNNLGLAQNDGSVVLSRSDGSVADTVGWGIIQSLQARQLKAV